MRPELVEGIWQLTWDLPMALAMGIVWVLALASGWASLRYLRAAPDLPHKAELLWGARWIAPLGLAWFALVTVVCAFGMSRTPYAFTFMRLSYLGFVGIIPLLLFLEPISSFLSRRSAVCRRFFDWLFARTRRRGRVVERYEAIGLILFVAIPLPVTGAWTGTVAAFLFGVRFRYALPAIITGILIAGTVVTLASLGVITLWSL